MGRRRIRRGVTGAVRRHAGAGIGSWCLTPPAADEVGDASGCAEDYVEAGQAGPPVHEDPVERGVTATGTDLVWLINITEHVNGKGKLTVKEIVPNGLGAMAGKALGTFRTLA
jgi:hypothetical protein